MRLPGLTVIMPNCNNASTIRRALDALLAQKEFITELVVVDDASTDESTEIIAEYAAREPVITFRRNRENRGIYPTIMDEYPRVKTPYVCGANSDDWILPGYLEKCLEMASRHPEAGILFGRMVIVDKDGERVHSGGIKKWKAPLYASPEKFLTEYLENESPSHSFSACTIYRTECMAEAGYFREELGHWADSFLIRAIGLKYGACYIPEEFACWRQHEGSLYEREKITRLLDIAFRAAGLMRSDEFRDRFPESHANRWLEGYRRLLIDGEIERVRRDLVKRRWKRLEGDESRSIPARVRRKLKYLAWSVEDRINLSKLRKKLWKYKGGLD